MLRRKTSNESFSTDLHATALRKLEFLGKGGALERWKEEERLLQRLGIRQVQDLGQGWGVYVGCVWGGGYWRWE